MKIAIREKLGLSDPRNSGFDRGGPSPMSTNLRRSEFRLENQGFSLECSKFVVDDGGEGEVGSSALHSLQFGIGRRGLIWSKGAAGSSLGWGLELLSLMRTRSMPGAQWRRSLGPSGVYPGQDITYIRELYRERDKTPPRERIKHRRQLHLVCAGCQSASNSRAHVRV